MFSDQFPGLSLCDPVHRGEIGELLWITRRNAIWIADVAISAFTPEIQNVHMSAHDILASACGSGLPDDTAAQNNRK